MGGKKSKVFSTELTAKQINLLLANTNFDENEIRNWHAGFIRDCPNGRLDKEKFAELHKQLYPGGKTANYCKFAFDAFDQNNDGTIDFDEFLLTIAANGQGNLEDRLAAGFDIYDISDDGQIDQKELAQMISAMYDLVGQTDRDGDQDPKKRAQEITAKLDVNSDRKLSKAEFVAGCVNDPLIRQTLTPNA